MRRRDVIGLAVVLGVAATGWRGAALAQASDAEKEQRRATIQAAKAAGVIGEQADGLLGFVGGAGDAATNQAVAEVNGRRTEVYREAAARNNVSVEAAGASTYETVIKPKLQPGQFYRPQGSGWVRK